MERGGGVVQGARQSVCSGFRGTATPLFPAHHRPAAGLHLIHPDTALEPCIVGFHEFTSNHPLEQFV
jgi:hypothetical protein